MTDIDKATEDQISAASWHHIGGDLEARVLEGNRYVDIRVKGIAGSRLFLSRGALLNALLLFPEYKNDHPAGPRKEVGDEG